MANSVGLPQQDKNSCFFHGNDLPEIVFVSLPQAGIVVNSVKVRGIYCIFAFGKN